MTSNFNLITDLDRLIHEPARLLIISYLTYLEEADFLFLLRETGLTKGNLSSHLRKLEDAGYIAIKKKFLQKKTQTLCRLTPAGELAFQQYRNHLKLILEV